MHRNKKCLFCDSEKFFQSWMRPTFYNSKKFSYKSCANCKLIIVDPLPDADDMKAMYPISYQQGADRTILSDPHIKLPGLRFTYTHHYKLIRQFSGNNSKILDYGCGNANFVVNAIHNNLYCEGTEFSKDHIKILTDCLPESKFYTIDDFLNNSTEKYDVIRLSNVLEHLINPKEILAMLISHLNPDGILLIEGPLETNFSIAFFLRKLHSVIKNIFATKKEEDHSVTHIFFANRENQHMLFKNLDLETLSFEIKENAWPYPETWNSCNSLSMKVKFILAKFSMLTSKLIPVWGNTFIYVGRKK